MARYKDQPKTLFLLDPPYLYTGQGAYNQEKYSSDFYFVVTKKEIFSKIKFSASAFTKNAIFINKINKKFARISNKLQKTNKKPDQNGRALKNTFYVFTIVLVFLMWRMAWFLLLICLSKKHRLKVFLLRSF